MGIFSGFFQSTDLVEGMARRLGADLSSDIAARPDSAALRLRSLVIRCAACREQEKCRALQAGCSRLHATPGYCMNKDELERLARSPAPTVAAAPDAEPAPAAPHPAPS